VLEVLNHHAKFGGARISPAAGVAKNVEFFFVCLSVCLAALFRSSHHLYASEDVPTSKEITEEGATNTQV